MMKKTLTTIGLSILLASTAHSITKEDRKIADEYLKLPSTIQLIESDETLMALSPEDMYKKLEEEGIIEDVKWRKKIGEWIKNHPDHDKLVESQEISGFEILPEFRYLDLESPKIIPELPWDGDPFSYDDSLFKNQLKPSYPGTATCIAKIRGNVGWFKAGPHTLSPWDKIMPLTDCVYFAKKRGIDPNKCYIAGCSPMTAMISSLKVAELVRDILLNKYT